MKKKVLIITYYWPPSGGPGVQRWLKFVKYLQDFNISPIIITVDPNNASYQIIDNTLENEIPKTVEVYKTKTLEPFNLYKKITHKNEIPYSGFANESKPTITQKISRFIRGNFFIPDARKGWNKFAFKKAVELILEHNIKTVITTSPPHSSQLVGLKIKNKLNVKWIADLRDPWTDIYYYKELLHTKIAKNIDSKLEKKVLEKADYLITVSDDIKRIFSDKIKLKNNNKIKVIPNGFDHSDFNKIVENEKKFTITYTGTISDIYDISSFIKVVSSIKFNDDIIIRFVGSITQNIKNDLQNSNFSNNIEFIDFQPHNKSIEFLLKSNMLLLAIPKIKNNKGILTGKLFEYLASKKPIINIGPIDGDAAKIIDECKAGNTFDYNDTENLLSFIENNYRKFLNKENINIDNNNSEKFSRKNLTKLLSDIINE